MSQPLRTVFLVLLLWFAGLGAATQFAKIAVPFAEVGRLYPGNADALGWLLSIISLTGAILGTLSGAIASRVGPMRLLLTGLVLGGGISLWQATIPGFPMMLVSRVIEGLSHLAIVVAAPTLMSQITRGRGRNMAMVLWSTFFGVAFALNAWFGLPLIRVLGLPAYFTLHGVLMLLIAGALAACRLNIHFETPAARVFGLDVFIDVHRQTYRSPFIATPPIGWLFYTLTFVSLLAILPDRLPEDIRGLIAGIMPLAGIIVSWLAVPLLLSVTAGITVVSLGFGLSIVTIGLLLLGMPLPFVCVALFSALGLVQGGSFAAVPELNLTPEAQALSYGAMAQMGNTGNLLGTPILLAVLWRTGEAGMFGFVVLVYLAAIAAHVWLGRRRRLEIAS
ncbi:MAG: MFS transporter [Ruegeria sp.]|uniref:MFS transporter n=1 Tax=Ruegeria sp. TaxID=1879320 RepID=UPI00349EF70E